MRESNTRLSRRKAAQRDRRRRQRTSCYRALRLEPLEDRSLMSVTPLMLEPLATSLPSEALTFHSALVQAPVTLDTEPAPLETVLDYNWCGTPVPTQRPVETLPASFGSLDYTLENPTGVFLHNTQFGNSIASHGNRTVIGMPSTGEAIPNSAKQAYVFDNSTGELLLTLQSPNLASQSDDRFGLSVAISDDFVAVGAPSEQGPSGWGVVHLYDAHSGAHLRTFPAMLRTIDMFGYSLALDGSTLVVGTEKGNEAYVFNAQTGDLLFALASPASDVRDGFGRALAVGDGLIAVGAPARNGWEFCSAAGTLANVVDPGPPPCGAVYAYDGTSGVLRYTLQASTPQAADRFGYSVAISAGRIAVGAPGDDTRGAKAGAAYVFDAATGTLQQTLRGDEDRTIDDHGWGNLGSFGASVAIEGNVVAVGTCTSDTWLTGVPGCGFQGPAIRNYVSVFDAQTGQLVSKLADPTYARTGEANFGQAISLASGALVVGDPHASIHLRQAGAAYLFDVTTGQLRTALQELVPTADDFGEVLAADAGLIAVGATRDKVPFDTASVSIFDAHTGQLVSTLQRPAGCTDFGSQVAISGTTVVVTGKSDYHGRVFLFDALSGRLLRELTSPASCYEEFGQSLAISGNTVAVGCERRESPSQASWLRTGFVLLYDADTGAHTGTLHSPAYEGRTGFGQALCFADGALIVGAPQEENDAGNVYVFDVLTRSFRGNLARPADAGSLYGRKIAGDEGTIVVDAGGGLYGVFDSGTLQQRCAITGPWHTPTLLNYTSIAVAGSTIAIGRTDVNQGALVFDAADGRLLATLETPTDGGGPSFGSVVAADGGRLVVGSIHPGQPFRGSVSVFNIERAPAEVSLSSTDLGPAPAVDTVVGTLQTIDPNGPDQFTYALVDGDGSGDNAAFAIDGQGRLLTARALGGSTEQEYHVRVRSTDSTGLSIAKSFTITVAATPVTLPKLGTLLGQLDPTTSTPQAHGLLGSAIAVDGDTAVIGMPGAPGSNGDSFGRACLVDTATGAVCAILQSPTPMSRYWADRFGFSVAIEGDLVAVGSPHGGDLTGMALGPGAVYLYDRRSGAYLRTLNMSGFRWGDDVCFGASLAIGDGKVVVGARNSSAVHVFEAASGQLLFTLNGPNQAYSPFGPSLAMGDGLLVIGDQDAVSHAGQARLYDLATGQLLRTIVAPAGVEASTFASAVALAGRKVIIAAPSADQPSGQAVYVFDADTGALQQTIDRPAVVGNRHFGVALAVDGDLLAIGTSTAPVHLGNILDRSDAGQGMVCVFDLTTGRLVQSIAGAEADDGFGRALAVSGATLLVGAPDADTDGVDAGAAFIFNAHSAARQATISAPPAQLVETFGEVMAADGDLVVVGATAGNARDGVAYVFRGASGELVATLANPDPELYKNFGCRVAISGHTVAVAASSWILIFDATSGLLQDALRVPDTVTDRFRSFTDLAISGDRVVTGVHYDVFDRPAAEGECRTYLITSTVKACLFDLSTGVMTLAVTIPDGSSLAIADGLLVVGLSRAAEDGATAYVLDAATGQQRGALFATDPTHPASGGQTRVASGAGVIVVSHYGGWGGTVDVYDADTLQPRFALAAPDHSLPEDFGAALAVADGLIVVGATSEWTRGHAYLFDATTGQWLGTLDNPVPQNELTFGESVAISNGKAYVGAGTRDRRASGTLTVEPGAVYAFDASPAPRDVTLATPKVQGPVAAGAVVSTIATADPNAGDTFTYTLVDGEGSGDNAAFAIDDQGRLVAAVDLNVSGRQEYSIRIRSTDRGGQWVERAVVLTVIATVAPPTPVLPIDVPIASPGDPLPPRVLPIYVEPIERLPIMIDPFPCPGDPIGIEESTPITAPAPPTAHLPQTLHARIDPRQAAALAREAAISATMHWSDVGLMVGIDDSADNGLPRVGRRRK